MGTGEFSCYSMLFISVKIWHQCLGHNYRWLPSWIIHYGILSWENSALISLKEYFPFYWKMYLLNVHKAMRFQYTGTPSHFSCYVCSWLNSTFPGLIVWPFSPDMNLHDFSYGDVSDETFMLQKYRIVTASSVAFWYLQHTVRTNLNNWFVSGCPFSCHCEALKPNVTFSNSVKKYVALWVPIAWCDIYVKCIVKFKLKDLMSSESLLFIYCN